MTTHWSVVVRHLVPVLSLCGFGLAQQRVPIPAPVAVGEPGKAVVEAHPLPAANYGRRLDLGDAPDFVPMRDVLDAEGTIIESRPDGQPYVLAFTNGAFEPEPGIDARLRQRVLRDGASHTWGFVMIEGRMAEAKMAHLRRLGLQLLGVHTWQSVKARIPVDSLAALSRLSFVRWVGYARANQKVDPDLATALAAGTPREKLAVIVNPFESDIGQATRYVQTGELEERSWPGLDIDAAAGATTATVPNGPFHARLLELGFEFRSYNAVIHAFEGKMTRAQIEVLLEEDWVHTVELDPGQPEADSMPVPRPVPHDQAIPMVHQDGVRDRYNGVGVPTGLIDSGLDSTPWHRDFSNIKVFYFDSALTPFSNHGTHVAGTFFGRGIANDDYRGAAPGVGSGGPTNRIFLGKYTTSISTNAGRFGRNGVDSAGKVSPYPRLISNSYSIKSSFGFYGTEANARTIDAATYDKRQLWVFSAGNSTSTTFWCGSPSSAKNVLTVGSVIDRFNASRSTNQGDLAFTSRWGVRDLRTKPEVCAPGDTVTSTLWNSTTGYFNNQGTSMATPLVAGCLASKLQQSPTYQTHPELMKARIVASARNGNSFERRYFRAPATGAASTAMSGWGLINSREMIYNSSSASALTRYGSFSSTGQSSFMDVPIGSNTQYVRMVLCTIERAASSQAAQARLNNVNAFIDFSPIQSRMDFGDYSLASSRETVLSRGVVVPTAARGKTARFKVYARSIVSSSARWAIVVVQYARSPHSGNVSVQGFGTTNVVRPNSTYTLTCRMSASSSASDFRAGRLAYSGAFRVSRMYRTTDDGILHGYTSTNNHMSSPFPRVGLGLSNGMVVGTGRNRELQFVLVSPSSGGLYTLTTFGTVDSPTQPAPLYSHGYQVCVDGTPPTTIPGLASSSHSAGQWNNSRRLAFQWSRALDNGCAGLAGLACVANTSPTFAPATVNKSAVATTHVTVVPGDSSSGYYFHIRGIDRAGNRGLVRSIGPFKIDTAPPVINGLTLNGGAPRTANLQVKIDVAATDSRSGVAEIRYGAGQFGAWLPFVASRTIDLASIGASGSAGMKTVTVEVKDRAGNVSPLASETIEYVPVPAIAQVTSTFFNLTKDHLVLRGTGFDGVAAAKLGSKVITSSWTAVHEDDWFEGRIRIVDATELWLYPPQNLPPGAYSISVTNSIGAVSNTVTSTAVVWTATDNRLLTQHTVSVGRVHHLGAVLGTNPAATTQITMISPDLRPSVIPGLVSMSIGNNWTVYLLVPNFGFDLVTKNSVFGGTVPALLRGKSLYYQTAFLRPNTFPLPVSTAQLVTFR